MELRRLLRKRNLYLAGVGLLLFYVLRIHTMLSWDIQDPEAPRVLLPHTFAEPENELESESKEMTDEEMQVDVITEVQDTEGGEFSLGLEEEQDGDDETETKREIGRWARRREEKKAAKELTQAPRAKRCKGTDVVNAPPFKPLHRVRPGTRNESCFDPRRDYNVWPIRIQGWFSGQNRPCDVPCFGDAGGAIGKTPDNGYSLPSRYVDASNHGGTDACTPGFTFTMENVVHSSNHDHTKRFADLGSSYTLHGNVRAESDVMMQYFSWFEYPIMNPVPAKTGKAQVVAFITNCGPNKRLKWLSEVQKHGVVVHSYGPCANNMPQLPRVGLWLEQKNNVTAAYKFTWAFENSEAKDYVTEKLFGPFTVGSVPIYDGAPNVDDFLPSPKSAILARDFASPKELAEYILYLDRNDTAYREYLKWKAEGPTGKFIAHADQSRSHFKCRFCTRVADIQRLHVGQQFAGNPWQEENDRAREENQGCGNRMVRVRERGKFWLREIYISEPTYQELMAAITERYQDQPEKFPIYAIYDLWDDYKTPILSDKQVLELLEGDAYPEVEIIFLEPGAPNRYSYTDWYYKKKGKPVPPRPPYSGYE